MTIQPRLLPDFAAVPTRRERAGVRSHWRAAQVSMWDTTTTDPDAPTPCAVCTSAEHTTDRCPIGTAPTLDLSTSAERDENRLTDADRTAIAERVTELARRTRAMGDAERYTTCERAGWHAIGCDARDLRDSELAEIGDTVRRIITKTP